jgi:hypothetical protein
MADLLVTDVFKFVAVRPPQAVSDADAQLPFVRDARAERIATFDNDGTFWVEHPMYTQMAFALDYLKAMAPQPPEWKNTQPFKATARSDDPIAADKGGCYGTQRQARHSTPR